MITTKQEKNKTTIIVERRLRKTELAKIVRYLSFLDPGKRIVRKNIQKVADVVTKGAWEQLKKKRGFKWS